MSDFYALDTLQGLASRAPNLRVLLAASDLQGHPPEKDHAFFVQGSVLDALNLDAALLGQRDVYVAGPLVMLCEVARALDTRGVAKARLHTDSFGI